MRKQQWNAGDLVEVTMHEKLGWGDKRESYLVLVLGRHYAKQKQTYPLTADLERARKTVYRVLKKKGGSNGGTCLMGLSDWTIGEMTCTNRLVQTSCVEE
jgi:hypothetical protein